MRLSAVMQEYLAGIYRLAYYQHGDPYVSTSALASIMSVSAPAVTRMVQRLKEGGYLEHEPYRGIALTSKGEQEALMNIRRHRIVECFLVKVMKFSWDEVHESADEIGAVIRDIVVDRMEKMAGGPRRCPHGEPIPSPDGAMPHIDDYPLTQAKSGKDYLVSRVNAHDVEKLIYMDNLGLTPGVSVHLVERAPFEGPLQLQIGDITQFISHAMADAVRVCGEGEFEL